MSENITHTGSMDDTFRLVLQTDSICRPFQETVRTHHDFARLGGITRYGDEFTVELLSKFREHYRETGDIGNDGPKLAFVLGWLCHRAADRQMKPVFRALCPNSPVKPTECSVYNDALIFREVYEVGRREPYHPQFFTGDMPGEEVFRVMLQRALLELHTLIPDRTDIEGWFERLFELRQRFYVDCARYAEAIFNPDPAKVQKYLVEPNFYDAEEPIIATARAIQRGETVTAQQVAQAVKADAKSHYGQILALAFAYIQTASEFFIGNLTREEMAERFNIGKPGVDGKWV